VCPANGSSRPAKFISKADSSLHCFGSPILPPKRSGKRMDRPVPYRAWTSLGARTPGRHPLQMRVAGRLRPVRRHWAFCTRRQAYGWCRSSSRPATGNSGSNICSACTATTRAVFPAPTVPSAAETTTCQRRSNLARRVQPVLATSASRRRYPTTMPISADPPHHMQPWRVPSRQQTANEQSKGPTAYAGD
jgi:hypothetical protein